MADPAAAPANGTTVTAATESDGETAPPPVHQSRAARDAEMRAAFLAADVEADLAEEPAKPAPKKPAPKVEEPEDEVDDAPEETSDEDEEVEVDDDDDLDETEEGDEDVEKDDDAGAEKDPELAKRFEQLRKREQRMRQQLADAQQNATREFESQKQQFLAEAKPLLEDGRKFQALKAKKHDVAHVLKELGYVEDDFEEASQILWGLSKTGSADPKNKAASARLLRDRELRDETRKANARAEAIEQKLAARDAEEEAARRGSQYMARVTKAIGDASPLVKKRIELQPKSSSVAMNKIALALMDKNGGQVPEPKKVVAAYEKKLRAQRELALKLGGDEPATPAAPAKGKPAPAAAKPAIKVETRKPLPTEREQPKKTLLPSRTEMIENLGKLQRGEIQFDDTDN